MRSNLDTSPNLSPRPSLVESLGLRPFRQRAREAAIALTGAPDVPPSRFDLSSLRLLSPKLALPLWLGRFTIPRTVIFTNLFNHRQKPVEEGWSVRRTQVEDFRGRQLSYDSHNGTDLAVPRGSTAVAPAPARVAKIWTEFNRGGHKVLLDHGQGLMTCSAHLARVLVREGQFLTSGQPYALTGYSGLDGFATFPFGVPHIHFNVWLDGYPVDPFGRVGELSLWRTGVPVAVPPSPYDEAVGPNHWDLEALTAVIESCKTPSVRRELMAITCPQQRVAEVISHLNYYPTRFDLPPRLVTSLHPREERLYLPFSSSDFDGACFADELP